MAVVLQACCVGEPSRRGRSGWRARERDASGCLVVLLDLPICLLIPCLPPFSILPLVKAPLHTQGKNEFIFLASCDLFSVRHLPRSLSPGEAKDIRVEPTKSVCLAFSGSVGCDAHEGDLFGSSNGSQSSKLLSFEPCWLEEEKDHRWRAS